ncbi:hypothetical protein RRF57_001737 [Xylaria bambusicola]|uniref:Nephrocystin 3-like N-terminal domain-containing protein n=1 Tax=Xylaria bambusicola TaxID=326684 RepID=A0AAN7UJ14_9PEZI
MVSLVFPYTLSTLCGILNAPGVLNVTADGHARVQVGNNYSTINNYQGLGPYPADLHLKQPDKAAARATFLQKLYTSKYEERKNRNPRRADGTCEWFTSHRVFQHWRNEPSAIIWVSADPGCGKSVLAKHLVDDILPSSASRTTCYFFFKDDFEDQKGSEGALCCLLHQLFTQQPSLLADEFLEDFNWEGDHLFASFGKLWEFLLRATRDYENGEIVCILDALDECVDPSRLVKALTQHYGTRPGNSALKFLVTSRPYLRIQREFQDLKEAQPTIHLSGESEDEVDKIEQEIAICINQRTEDVCKYHQLNLQEKKIIQDELAAVKNRTYLWVHLVFAAIEDAVFLSRDDLHFNIHNLPHTVEEAYNNILRKSHNPRITRKILHIIVAANRPLLLAELGAILAFRKESHRSHKDLERNILPLDRLNTAVREACGLFVVIQDWQVFLLHQTAREFLIRGPSKLPESCASFDWQHSLDLEDSHRLLSGVCMRYLLLDDFVKLDYDVLLSVDAQRFDLLSYAACEWASHYRQAGKTRDGLDQLALQLCDTKTNACSTWKEVDRSEILQELTTTLLVASYLGLDNLVSLILRKDKRSFAGTGWEGERTALSCASGKGYDSVVRILLKQVPKHRVMLWKMFHLRSLTIIDRKDNSGKTPLSLAASNGHQSIVEQLLKKGANVNKKDKYGLTALFWAAFYGYDGIVSLLLAHGARPVSGDKTLESRTQDGRTPLMDAALDVDNAAVKLWLDSGANTEAVDDDHMTALLIASEHGSLETTKLLLDAGAKVDTADITGFTALMHASSRSYNEVTKLLLDYGAKVDIADKEGATALMYASIGGYNEVMKLLLDYSAKVDITDVKGRTALMRALIKGYNEVAKLLVDYGAEVDMADAEGSTAVMYSSTRGYYETAKVLLNYSAKVDITN